MWKDGWDCLGNRVIRCRALKGYWTDESIRMCSREKKMPNWIESFKKGWFSFIEWWVFFSLSSLDSIWIITLTWTKDQSNKVMHRTHKGILKRDPFALFWFGGKNTISLLFEHDDGTFVISFFYYYLEWVLCKLVGPTNGQLCLISIFMHSVSAAVHFIAGFSCSNIQRKQLIVCRIDL